MAWTPPCGDTSGCCTATWAGVAATLCWSIAISIEFCTLQRGSDGAFWRWFQCHDPSVGNRCEGAWPRKYKSGVILDLACIVRRCGDCFTPPRDVLDNSFRLRSICACDDKDKLQLILARWRTESLKLTIDVGVPSKRVNTSLCWIEAETDGLRSKLSPMLRTTSRLASMMLARRQ